MAAECSFRTSGMVPTSSLSLYTEYLDLTIVFISKRPSNLLKIVSLS